MARVPTADLNAPQLTTERGPQPVQVTGEAVGGIKARQTIKLGQALENTAEVMQQNALRFQKREDDEVLRQFTVDFENSVREKMYNPENGIMLRQGVNAKGSTQELTDFIDSRSSDIGQQLNPRTLARWNSSVSTLRNAHLNNTSRHESVEFQKGEIASTTALANTYSNDAVAADPLSQEFNMFKDLGENALKELADMQGWSSEILQEELEKYRSNLWVKTIERVEVDNAALAEKLYEDNKSEILGESQAALEKSLEVSSLRDRAQVQTDQLIDRHGTDYDAAMKAARKLSDPKLRDEVVSRIKGRMSEYQAIQSFEQQDAADNIWETINGWIQAETRSITINDLPANQFAKLSGYQQDSVRRMIDKIRNGELIETDNNVLESYWAMSPSARVKMSFEQFEQTYRAHLNDTDYSTARADLVRVKEAATNPPTLANLDGIATTGKRLGVKYGITMESGNKDGALFMQAFQESVQLIQQSTGRNMTLEELDDLAANLVMETVTEKDTWGIDDPLSTYQFLGGLDMTDLNVKDSVKQINAMRYQMVVGKGDQAKWQVMDKKPMDLARRLKARSLKGEDGSEPTEAEVAKVTDEQAINAWIDLVRRNTVRLLD